MDSLRDNIQPNRSINIAAIASNTTTSGTGIDRSGAASCLIVFETGTVTDGTYAMSVEESDASGSGYAAVPAASLVGSLGASLTGADDNVFRRIEYVGTKRYVRAVITSTGVTTGGTMGAFVVLGNPRHGPLA